MFTGTHGKENCLAVCRKFGLTGCEWDFAAGDCYAHMKSVSIGNDYRSSFCYKFNKYPGKMIQVTSQLTNNDHIQTAREQNLALSLTKQCNTQPIAENYQRLIVQQNAQEITAVHFGLMQVSCAWQY